MSEDGPMDFLYCPKCAARLVPAIKEGGRNKEFFYCTTCNESFECRSVKRTTYRKNLQTWKRILLEELNNTEGTKIRSYEDRQWMKKIVKKLDDVLELGIRGLTFSDLHRLKGGRGE